ncbi:hypothetical protein LVD17_25735 [Fulvivirga ulvae]|uniref:hypothetical protein n=1 Tax=Fulvivirga ulvae TaxID=2904245 RepID=UPI001F173893|nr:hypothetical protein [Fulvivirga ulvae]UII31695.1 hypothetical protein LVD17_25735 [Fulvivirga ulvae]
MNDQENTFGKRIVQWTELLDFNRLLVMAIIIFVHTCVIIPPTLLVLLHMQAGEWPYLVVTVFSFAILVSNLAVMSTKITVPVFALSTLVHAGIIFFYLLY